MFDFDKATLQANAKTTLDKLAELVKLQNPPSVAIEGYTDSKGEDTYNDKLSLDRARSVEDYLVGKGIDRGKLRTKGLGESKPVAPNETDSGADNPRWPAKEPPRRGRADKIDVRRAMLQASQIALAQIAAYR